MITAAGFSVSVSLADPPGSSVLLPAVAWLEGTLLGSVATTAAILAIAAIGVMMLTGRIAVRPALATILGCFILFGASTIAAGIRSSGADRPAAYDEPPQVLREPASPPPQTASSRASDPHAGASVPPE